MNPLYNQLMNQSGMQFNNPMQKMMYIMQAMQNPAQFVKQHIPDIPDEIQNNPNDPQQNTMNQTNNSSANNESILRDEITQERSFYGLS